MDPLKIGEFIKKIRKDNNLTQKELADKLNVTYQAVSKWENGINLPEISIMKQMSDEFNVSIESFLEGEHKDASKKRNYWKIGIIISVVILIMSVGIYYLYKHHEKSHTFNFKTVSTTCPEFKVTGSIAYDTKKSSMYINIDYCGVDDTTKYENIKCSLYEKSNGSNKLVTSCKEGNNVTLDDYLKESEVKIDNYAQACKKYDDNSLFLEIEAVEKNNKVVTYKIPLSLNENCN